MNTEDAAIGVIMGIIIGLGWGIALTLILLWK